MKSLFIISSLVFGATAALSQPLASIEPNRAFNTPLMHIDSAQTQKTETAIAKTEGEGEAVKMVDAILFDTALIPCQDMYDYSWDSLHLDMPKVQPTDTVDVNLQLVETSCDYVHPCSGPITSNFGWRRYRMHKGIDIDLQTGDSVYAAFDGVIRIAKYNYGGFGHYVVIRHYNGLETLYGHLSKRLVIPNQTVKAGEVIGLGGNTGRSTGSHLHFEVLYRGCQINPNKIISFTDHKLKSDTVSLDIKDFKYTAKYKSGAPNPNSTMYYRVRSGDSLWRIAKRYGTSIDRLCRLNGISRSTTLRIGRTLRVR